MAAEGIECPGMSPGSKRSARSRHPGKSHTRLDPGCKDWSPRPRIFNINSEAISMMLSLDAEAMMPRMDCILHFEAALF